MKDFVKNTIIV